MPAPFKRATGHDSLAHLSDLERYDLVNDHSDSIEQLEGNLGFIDYNNAGADQSLTADTWTTLTNDGAGAFTNKTYAPVNIPELQDGSGNLDFQYLELGDSLLIRADFTVTPTVNGATLDLRYSLGQGGNAYTLPRLLGPMANGAGIGYRFVVETYIYMGDENTRGGVGTLQIRSSEDATVSNAGWVIQVLR